MILRRITRCEVMIASKTDCSAIFLPNSGYRGTIPCGACGRWWTRCWGPCRRFNKMYARVGRPSIAPEKLLRALLLQGLYSVRSERLLMEQLDYNLLFRWFVGLSMDDPVWDATVYSKNRERLLEADIAQAFFEQVVELARQHQLLSDEHFSVDGTLIEAWAGR